MPKGSKNPGKQNKPHTIEPSETKPELLRIAIARRFLANAPICSAKLRNGKRCRKFAVKNRKRCRLHGGASTGPRTIEGKLRALANLKYSGRSAAEVILNALIERNQPPVESDASEPSALLKPAAPQQVVELTKSRENNTPNNQPKSR